MRHDIISRMIGVPDKGSALSNYPLLESHCKKHAVLHCIHVASSSMQVGLTYRSQNAGFVDGSPMKPFARIIPACFSEMVRGALDMGSSRTQVGPSASRIEGRLHSDTRYPTCDGR